MNAPPVASSARSRLRVALGIENELTQEDVDSADLVLESVDVGVENEDRFEQKMAEGKFLKVGHLGCNRRSGKDHRPGH